MTNLVRLIHDNQERVTDQVVSSVRGVYTNWDHFRFQVLLPLKSFFGLTAEEQHQKTLYDSASKVTQATSRYFSRVHEIAKRYRIDKLELVRKSSLSSEDKTLQNAYWKGRTFDQFAKLPEVRAQIEKDATCQKMGHQMLSGYAAWIERLSAAGESQTQNLWDERMSQWAPRTGPVLGLPQEAFSQAALIAPAISQVVDSLLSKFSSPELGLRMLEKVRTEYAQAAVQSVTLSHCVDQLDFLVDQAVVLGLGDPAVIRNDLIQAAAHTHRDQLRTYIDSLHASYDNTGKLQEYFKDQINQLSQKPQPITAKNLGELRYSDSHITITLSQCLDAASLSGLAKLLQKNCDEVLGLNFQMQGVRLEIQNGELKNAQQQLAKLEKGLAKKKQEAKKFLQEFKIVLPDSLIIDSLKEKAQIATDLIIAAGVQQSVDLITQEDSPAPVGHVKLTLDELALVAIHQKMVTTPSEWLKKTDAVKQQEKQPFIAALVECIDRQIEIALTDDIPPVSSSESPVDKGYDSLDDMQGPDSDEESF